MDSNIMKILKQLLEEKSELKKNSAWHSSQSYRNNQVQFLLEKFEKKILAATKA